MTLEEIVKILIIIHAITGTIALLAGIFSLSAKKGGKIHKRSGKWFYYSMLVSVVLAIFISNAPNHKNAFLFIIGLFSGYFVLSGYRALKIRKTGIKFWDYLIPIVYLLIALGMIFLALRSGIKVVLLIFGCVALGFALRDLILLRKPDKLKRDWQKLHLSKMIAAYISATTAFLVANQLIPGLWGWLSPTVLGTILITYWMTKLNRQMAN